MFMFSCMSYRGHTVRAVCESFQMSKDAGFKVVAHMMPDLPNVGWERDIEQFIVSIEDFLIVLFRKKSVTSHKLVTLMSLNIPDTSKTLKYYLELTRFTQYRRIDL